VSELIDRDRSTSHLAAAEALVRYAEAMIDQAEQAAVEAYAVLGALPVFSDMQRGLWRAQLLDRLDLVLASQHDRQVFAHLKGVD